MITLQAVCIHCHTVTMTEVDPEKMNRYLSRVWVFCKVGRLLVQHGKWSAVFKV